MSNQCVAVTYIISEIEFSAEGVFTTQTLSAAKENFTRI